MWSIHGDLQSQATKIPWDKAYQLTVHLFQVKSIKQIWKKCSRKISENKSENIWFIALGYLNTYYNRQMMLILKYV